MRTVLTDASGTMPVSPMQSALADPRIGVTPNGELLTAARIIGAFSVTATVAPGTVIGSAAPAYTDCTVLTWGDFVKTVSAAPSTITPISTWFRQAILTAPSTNADTVMFGPNTSCRHSLIRGTSYFIPMIPGGVYNMANWYAMGTLGDQIIVLWVQ